MTSPSDAELLPCPFCGGQPVLMDLAGYEVSCQCGVNFCDGPSLESAVSGWNRRAAIDAALAQEPAKGEG